MPTTLPARSRDSTYGRKRGISRATTVLLLWALTMLALTLPIDTAFTADATMIDVVLQ